MSEENKEHSSGTLIGRETSKLVANSDSKSTEKTIEIWTVSKNIIHAIEGNIRALAALVGEDDKGDFSTLVIDLRKAVSVVAAAVEATAAKKKQDSDAAASTLQLQLGPAIRDKTPVSDAQRKDFSKRKRESSKGDEDVGLKMVGQKKYRKTCSADGCTKNKAQKEGVCKKHGAKIKLCNSEGCSNIVVKGGVCKRHGAKVKLCSTERCTNQAVRGGVCVKHGAKRKKLCSSESCTNQVIKGGVCVKHGAKRNLCSSEGCTNQARKGGVCIKHGAKEKRCGSDGCTNRAVKGGVCRRHGADRNPNDESTAFPSCFGSEFEKTTVTYPNDPNASADSASQAQVQGGISIPEEVIVCGVIGDYEEV